MKVEELQNSLEVHEQCLLERKAVEQETVQNTNHALQAKSYKYRGTGRGRGSSRGGRGGRNGGRCGEEQNKDVESNEQSSCGGRGKPGGRGGRKNPDKRNIQCFTCNKYGHYSSECWHNDNAKKEQSNEVNLAKEELVSDSNHIALMSLVTNKKNDGKWITTRDDYVQMTTSRNKDRRGKNIAQEEHVSSAGEAKHAKKEEMSWYLDSACSNHMTGNKSWLIDLDTSVKSIVRFADDSVIRAEGSGKVLITRKDGRPVYMHNVLYVPTMKSNLLSLGQLLEKGYTMNLQKRNIEVCQRTQSLTEEANTLKPNITTSENV
ncbi:hypothetical protein V8G54_019578 [Vigna mungo]|uniref:CCHC-type domain-containing protein n=1 Tax=Vigna mungo TaxID=3915 RepID=A0AAQ3NBX1_VIGMU